MWSKSLHVSLHIQSNFLIENGSEARSGIKEVVRRNTTFTSLGVLISSHLFYWLDMSHFGSAFSDLKASGNGEIYNDGKMANKFQQFGWRCTTNETGYKPSTLIGNWNEERYTTKFMTKNKPLPSQHSHYFETTHKMSYVPDDQLNAIPEHVVQAGRLPTEPRTFPGHQPELDHPSFKRHYTTFESTSMAAYKNPKEMRP